MNGIDLAEHAGARSPAARLTADGLQRLVLSRVWGSLWRHLPMLAISAAATALAAALAVLTAGGNPLLIPILLALFAGPSVMALLAVAQGALVDDDTDLRTYLRALKTTAVRSTGHSLVPALCMVSLLAANDVYTRTGNAFMLFSLGIATTATVLTLAGFTVLMPLAVARPALRGRRLWVTSWYLLGRWPVRFLAPIALTGLALWVAFTFSSTVVLLLPAPIALLAGAAYWCCAVELGADDVVVPDGSPDR